MSFIKMASNCWIILWQCAFSEKWRDFYIQHKNHHLTNSIEDQRTEKWKSYWSISTNSFVLFAHVLMKNLKSPLVNVHYHLGLLEPQNGLFYERMALDPFSQMKRFNKLRRNSRLSTKITWFDTVGLFL